MQSDEELFAFLDSRFRGNDVNHARRPLRYSHGSGNPEVWFRLRWLGISIGPSRLISWNKSRATGDVYITAIIDFHVRIPCRQTNLATGLRQALADRIVHSPDDPHALLSIQTGHYAFRID